MKTAAHAHPRSPPAPRALGAAPSAPSGVAAAPLVPRAADGAPPRWTIFTQHTNWDHYVGLLAFYRDGLRLPGCEAPDPSPPLLQTRSAERGFRLLDACEEEDCRYCVVNGAIAYLCRSFLVDWHGDRAPAARHVPRDGAGHTPRERLQSALFFDEHFAWLAARGSDRAPARPAAGDGCISPAARGAFISPAAVMGSFRMVRHDSCGSFPSPRMLEVAFAILNMFGVETADGANPGEYLYQAELVDFCFHAAPPVPHVVAPVVAGPMQSRPSRLLKCLHDHSQQCLENVDEAEPGWTFALRASAGASRGLGASAAAELVNAHRDGARDRKRFRAHTARDPHSWVFCIMDALSPLRFFPDKREAAEGAVALLEGLCEAATPPPVLADLSRSESGGSGGSAEAHLDPLAGPAELVDGDASLMLEWILRSTEAMLSPTTIRPPGEPPIHIPAHHGWIRRPLVPVVGESDCESLFLVVAVGGGREVPRPAPRNDRMPNFVPIGQLSAALPAMVRLHMARLLSRINELRRPTLLQRLAAALRAASSSAFEARIIPVIAAFAEYHVPALAALAAPLGAEQVDPPSRANLL
jgi:hypothetical protein